MKLIDNVTSLFGDSTTLLNVFKFKTQLSVFHQDESKYLLT